MRQSCWDQHWPITSDLALQGCYASRSPAPTALLPMFLCIAFLPLLIVTHCAAPVCSPKHIHLPPNLDNPAPLDSQGVLVDPDHQAVLQDLLGTRGDGAEIRGHEEWGCHHRPQGHLGAGLLVAKAKVSNDELEGRGGKDRRGRKGLETGLLCHTW